MLRGFLLPTRIVKIEMKQSSSCRELESVSFALRSFAPILHDCSVKLYTDNKAVAFITDSGSNKPYLNAIAKDIFSFTSVHGIRLSVEWIPRTLNQKADYYSKIVDFDDWCVSNDFFFLDGVPSLWIVLLVMQIPSCLGCIRAFTVLTLWV